MSTRRHRCLVTGGAGFIGSELVRQLAAGGHGVTVFDNLVNGRRENLEGLDDAQVKLIVGDIRDADHLQEALRSADLVFHLACLGVRHSIHSPEENHNVNATATLKLLALAKAADVSRFVYVSTSEVYGTARLVPMAEDHPTLPMTVYGAAKLAGEAYSRAYHRTYGYPVVIVRPFNAYGPRSHHEGDSGEVIPKFMLRCMAGQPMMIFGDGTQTRDFTFVNDSARGIIAAGFCDQAIGETINLGSGSEITIKRLATEIAAVVGAEGAQVVHDAPRPGDVLRLYADITRARQILDFQPTVTLREGLRQLHAWYCGRGRSAASLLEDERVRNWEQTGVAADG